MKVSIIIVTYNRKELLLQCLKALMLQTYKITTLIVVNNASTDGTEDYVKNSNLQGVDKIKWVNLKNNIGGAGGFFSGIEYALKQDAEWIWMMDDDGYPEPECLQKLTDEVRCREVQAISPLQVNIHDVDKLAFPVWVNGKQLRGNVGQVLDNNFIGQEANLFNGLLIHESVIKKIGLPKKELFIRGDEVEYTKRLLKNNIKFGTLTSAKFYHPSDDNERIKSLFGLLITRDAHSDFKNYYMFRNRAVAFIEDGNAWLLPVDFIRYTYYYLIVKKMNLNGLRLWLSATWDGIRGKLGRHPKY
ncbi:glycosyltransferase [Acinetobacter wuhouensis]|uniref:glycosyltransferase family 2 protein n=1 Tax=Acinetobacter wuhouensis TaxID=1879050 RepID=UPI000A348A75|nr:glycosyltransferase family 2 protein [Acinetobacter wuhouensis]AXQ20984.1 glycosyltransferase [Acinetobacter wuhouensis]